MRSEEFERTRRYLAAQAGAAIFRGPGLLAYDTTRPWNAVFQEATHSTSVSSKTFWDREARDKAFMFLTHLRSAGDVTKTDTALDSGPSAPGRGGRQQPRRKPSRGNSGGAPRGGPPPLPPVKKEGPPEVCIQWNRGACLDPCPAGRIHVCRSCGGSHRETECPKRSKGSKPKGGGRGSGKGSKA